MVGRVEAIMDELIDATGDRFAIDVMVVWSGNELVGSRGEVWPNESWDEVHGARGNIREIASGIQQAIRVLAAIRGRPRAGFVSVVLGNNAPVYHPPVAFNELNKHFATEARRLGVHTLDIKQPSTALSSRIYGICGTVTKQSLDWTLLRKGDPSSVVGSHNGPVLLQPEKGCREVSIRPE